LSNIAPIGPLGPFVYPVIPATWVRKPLKCSISFLEGPGIMASDFMEEGVPLLRISSVSGRYVTLNGCNYLKEKLVENKWSHFRVCNGDLLISGSASTGLCAEVREDTAGSIPYTGIIIVRPKEEVSDKDFLRWFLLSAEFGIQVELTQTGSTMKHYGPMHLAQMFLPVPPVQDQKRIAEYLDNEASQIDGLVAEKERMLALLEEKRLALISSAVTRGLHPKHLTKPSGVDWLGEIPEHWQIERAKNLFVVRDERSEEGDEELLTVSHITGVTSRAEKEVNMFKADDMSGYKKCQKHDFVTNTLWAWMGAMGISPLDGIVSPDYHVYTSKGQILPEFMELLCRSKPFVAEVIRWSKGVWSSRLRLYPENFFEIRFPVPPKSEQQEIVAVIATYKEKTTELADALVESIKLLKERRSALITAAVTGRLDSATLHA
jgi:type I restriction enzyme S subunit